MDSLYYFPRPQKSSVGMSSPRHRTRKLFARTHHICKYRRACRRVQLIWKHHHMIHPLLWQAACELKSPHVLFQRTMQRAQSSRNKYRCEDLWLGRALSAGWTLPICSHWNGMIAPGPHSLLGRSSAPHVFENIRYKLDFDNRMCTKRFSTANSLMV